MDLDVRTISGIRIPVLCKGAHDTVKNLRIQAAACMGADGRCRLLLRVRIIHIKCNPLAAISAHF